MDEQIIQLVGGKGIFLSAGIQDAFNIVAVRHGLSLNGEQPCAFEDLFVVGDQTAHIVHILGGDGIFPAILPCEGEQLMILRGLGLDLEGVLLQPSGKVGQSLHVGADLIPIHAVVVGVQLLLQGLFVPFVSVSFIHKILVFEEDTAPNRLL